MLGLALAIGSVVYVIDVLGQSECNRAECTWIGDLAYGSSATIVLGICLIVAGAIVWGVDWLFRRHSSLPVDVSDSNGPGPHA